jgi:DNA-binding CsgD family transcriptional regulator
MRTAAFAMSWPTYAFDLQRPATINGVDGTTGVICDRCIEVRVFPDRFGRARLIIPFHCMPQTAENTLTERERDIIALIAAGHSAKAIAQKMQLSPRTVERYIEDCRFKLQATNSCQLVSRAMASGQLRLGDDR